MKGTGKKYDLQIRQLKDTENREKYKVYGELINTYGYNVEEGAKKLEALNYYTNEMISIPLDPTKTPQENAQRYFASTTSRNGLLRHSPNSAGKQRMTSLIWNPYRQPWISPSQKTILQGYERNL